MTEKQKRQFVINMIVLGISILALVLIVGPDLEPDTREEDAAFERSLDRHTESLRKHAELTEKLR